MTTLHRLGSLIPLLPLLVLLAPAAFAQTTPAIFVESFLSCGGSFTDGLIQIDPVTGNRHLFVGEEDVGGVCATTGSGVLPLAIQRLGWDPAGAVMVADAFSDSTRLLRVTVPDGVGSVVSGCDAASFGGCLGSVVGTGLLGTLSGEVVTITGATANPPTLTPGDYLVGMSLFSPCATAGFSLVRIDPGTGDRVVLSGVDDDCVTTIGSGDPFLELNGLFATNGGTLIVADGDGGVGRLVEVDPVTGDRTVLSGCDAVAGSTCVGSVLGAGPVPAFAHSVVPLDATETTFAARMSLGGPCFGGSVVEVDRASGDRSLLSGEDPACAVVGAGEPFANLESVASLPSLDLVTSEDGGVDRIFQIDANTGARTVLSGCTTYASLSCVGPTIGTGASADGYGVLVVPEPAFSVSLLFGALTLARRARS